MSNVLSFLQARYWGGERPLVPVRVYKQGVLWWWSTFGCSAGRNVDLSMRNWTVARVAAGLGLPQWKGTINWVNPHRVNFQRPHRSESTGLRTEKILPWTSPHDWPDGPVWIGYFPVNLMSFTAKGLMALEVIFLLKAMSRGVLLERLETRVTIKPSGLRDSWEANMMQSHRRGGRSSKVGLKNDTAVQSGPRFYYLSFIIPKSWDIFLEK